MKKINNPEFWINKLENPDKVIFNFQEVNNTNKKIYKELSNLNLNKFYFDINDKTINLFTNSKLLNYANLTITGKYFFKKNGKQIKNYKIKDLIKNCNLDKALIIKKGITKKRVNIRRFPTCLINSSSKDTIHQDYFQETALSPYEPVIILQESADKEWVYIQSKIYPGWVLRKNIKFINNFSEYQNVYSASSFLRVIDDFVTTEPNIYINKGKTITFQMGDKIPIIHDNFHSKTQYSLNSYKVPTLNKSDKNKLLIKNNNSIHNGNLPFTRKNIIVQAFKLLGERYGWGGMNNRRDCSRFVSDIFNCFGLNLPRDCSVQNKTAILNNISLREKKISEKLKILDNLNSGDLIYTEGHVMIYLNKIGKNYYVIHNGSGFSYKNKKFDVHGVMIMPLNLNLLSRNVSYIEVLINCICL